MNITEYFAVPYKLITDTAITSYNFFSVPELRQLEVIIQTRYGSREISFSDLDSALETRVQAAVTNLFDTNSYTWTKQKDSLSPVYSPFERTDVTESDTETNSGTDTKTIGRTNSGSSTNTPATASTTSRRTYDNNTMTDAEKVTASGTDTNINSGSSSENTTDTFGHIITKAHTIKGKENVDYEAVIESERKVAEFNFISRIAETIVNNICLLVYNFDNSYEPYSPLAL